MHAHKALELIPGNVWAPTKKRINLFVWNNVFQFALVIHSKIRNKPLYWLHFIEYAVKIVLQRHYSMLFNFHAHIFEMGERERECALEIAQTVQCTNRTQIKVKYSSCDKLESNENWNKTPQHANILFIIIRCSPTHLDADHSFAGGEEWLFFKSHRTRAHWRHNINDFGFGSLSTLIYIALSLSSADSTTPAAVATAATVAASALSLYCSKEIFYYFIPV